MSKFSPFMEGVMSVIVLVPTVSYAAPKYVTPKKVNTSSVTELDAHQPWLEVGANMRSATRNFSTAKINKTKNFS